MCGNMANFLNFRLEKIIGLDPARPLIKNGNRLDRGHAKAVQVVHTNAGRYGEGNYSQNKMVSRYPCYGCAGELYACYNNLF